MKITKDTAGFTASGKDVVFAEYEELVRNPYLRSDLAQVFYKVNQKLIKELKNKNDSFAEQIQLRPPLQVKMDKTGVFLVQCYIGSESYIGTTVSTETILEQPYIALRLLDLLHDDYLLLQESLKTAAEIEKSLPQG